MEPKINVSKKVRVSKNRKKGWKKHSNIDEVEKFLEDKRADERQGGSLVDKANESLFFVDVKNKSQALVRENEGPRRKRKKFNAPLKSLQILENSSSVKPPSKPYQHQTASKKQPRRKVRVPQPHKVTTKTQKKDKFFNLWDEPEEKDEIVELSKEILSNRFPKVPAHRYQKPSLLPAVEPPHPGASYNPTFQDHQMLISQAVEVELKKEKEEEHLDRVLRKKFPTEDKAPTEASWIEEMSRGLGMSDDEASEENEDDKEEFPIIKTWGKPTDRETRKITVQRNAEKAEKKRQILLAQEKLEKKQRNDFQRIKQMKKELTKKEILSLEKQKKKEQLKLNSLYRPRRLGKEKYENPDLEVNLTEELRGSLRTLKMEGSILEDRFKSMQKRNIIEARSKKTLKRKYKLKKQVKRSHRDAQLEIDKLLKTVKGKHVF